MGSMWFVDAARVPVNFDTLQDANGLASEDAFRIVQYSNGSLAEFLWIRRGQAVTADEIAYAKANASTDPVPAPETRPGFATIMPNLTSPNGTKYKIVVDDAGVLSTVAL